MDQDGKVVAKRRLPEGAPDTLELLGKAPDPAQAAKLTRLKTRTLYDETTAWGHRENLPQSSVAA